MALAHRSFETILRGHESQRLAIESQAADWHDSLLHESAAIQEQMRDTAAADSSLISKRYPLELDDIVKRVASSLLAERRLERSIQRVQYGRPLWGSAASRLSEEAGAHRQLDAVADFRRSFDAAQSSIAKRCTDARAALARDTRRSMEDTVAAQFSRQLAECERLPQEEVGPAMARVAAECCQQLDAWMSMLKRKCGEEASRAEVSLRNTFAVEAEKILVDLAGCYSAEERERASQLAADLQTQKNEALSLAAVQMSAGVEERLASVRREAAAQLQQSLLVLKADMEREQDAEAGKMLSLLQREHAKTLADARMALANANTKALTALRDSKSRELSEELARVAAEAELGSQAALRDARAQLEDEMQSASDAAVSEVLHMMKRSQRERLQAESEALLRERDESVASIRQQAAAEQYNAVQELKQQFAADTEAALEKMRSALHDEKEAVLADTRRECEGLQARTIKALADDVALAKQHAKAAIIAECERDMASQVAALSAALLADRAKSEASLRSGKQAELHDKLQRLERQLIDETDLVLHEQTLQWNACRRSAEDALKEIVHGSSADGSDSDEAASMLPEGLSAFSKGQPEALASAGASVRRWVAALSAQYREAQRELKTVKTKLIKEARQRAEEQSRGLYAGNAGK